MISGKDKRIISEEEIIDYYNKFKEENSQNPPSIIDLDV